MKRATFSAAAFRDLDRTVAWIGAERPEAAIALHDVAMRAAEQVAEYPHLGVSRPEIAPEPTRFLFLAEYSYVIVYSTASNPPRILRVLHAARDLPPLLRQ